MSDEQPDDYRGLEAVTRLSRDLKKAAQTLSPDEARYLVDAYYHAIDAVPDRDPQPSLGCVGRDDDDPEESGGASGQASCLEAADHASAIVSGPGIRPDRSSTMKHFAYAQVSDAEYAVLKAIAQRDGLSISNFVRRCVNSYLLELGDDVPLLEEQAPGGVRPRRSTGNVSATRRVGGE
jgi:hypothetical protein